MNPQRNDGSVVKNDSELEGKQSAVLPGREKEKRRGGLRPRPGKSQGLRGRRLIGLMPITYLRMQEHNKAFGER